MIKDILNDAEERMKKTIEHFVGDLALEGRSTNPDGRKINGRLLR